MNKNCWGEFLMLLEIILQKIVGLFIIVFLVFWFFFFDFKKKGRREEEEKKKIESWDLYRYIYFFLSKLSTFSSSSDLWYKNSNIKKMCVLNTAQGT